MRVLVAMSGGVDSSVAAALLLDAGHDVVGATMKLWGGDSRLGLLLGRRRRGRPPGGPAARDRPPRLQLHRRLRPRRGRPRTSRPTPRGRTPNPCVECNRHLKFDRLLSRAAQLGFDAVATGHHARVVARRRRPATGCCRGADPAKDQSYVLHMLTQAELAPGPAARSAS